jgi:hypothetical protein
MLHQNADCKLCGKHAKLLKKSHIIPNFMYKGMLESGTKIIEFPLDNATERTRIHQTGYHEKYILCAKCDNVLIGQLEKYSSCFLYGGKSKDPPRMEKRIGPDGVKSIYCENLNYTYFKLFILSILWRSHISEIPFFKEISIPDYELELKTMLINRNPGSQNDFKVSIIAFTDQEGHLKKMMQSPVIIPFEEALVVLYFISGYAYFIELGARSNFTIFEKFNLREDGSIEIPILSGEIGNSFFKSLGVPAQYADFFIPPVQS